jgi:AAA domain, putative AbiEii toxin, Type IV TA system/AAA domain
VIRRERPPQEPRLLAAKRPDALRRLRRYAELGSMAKSQRRWPFEPDLVLESDALTRLTELFDGKCAYCETPTAELLLEWHRPPEEAMDLDGTVARDHYWWLFYDWDNLYPICSACRSHKGRRFPVRGRRSAPEARGPELDTEQPLLLDPFRDHPQRVLVYADDGTVSGADRRAEVTIEVLGLNRADLVAGRADAARQVRALFEPFARPAGSSPDNAIPDAVAGYQPYAGIRRWTLRTVFLQRGSDAAALRPLGLEDEAAFELVRRATSGRTVEVSSPAPPVEASLANVRLESMEVRNFRAIEHVALQFREPLSDREPWLLLLGENGVGKSSLLKAVALALVDEEERRRRAPDASEVVRRGARTGEVRLRFSDGRRVELGFDRGSPDFRLSGDAPPVVVLGYGPTRLPPPPDLSPPPAQRVDVDNLFDPRAPLSDAEAWLADTAAVPTEQFNLHATDLKSLLPMREEDRLRRRDGRLFATSYGVSVALPELSDGFRSVIALATDLMLHLSAYWDSMSSAEGLLLLDELEVHLHPQWRMTIVTVLQKVFPRLRVIATTHDPLCLQQTEPGEVVVLRRTSHTGVEAVPRDVPKGLRADQLLTGDWFGLATTTDVETAALVEEHGKLLLQPQTAARKADRERLEGQLRGRLGHFAETSIERLAHDVAAEVMREESITLGEATADERAQLAASVADGVRRRRRRPR